MSNPLEEIKRIIIRMSNPLEEDGIKLKTEGPHDKRSIELYRFIADLDFEQGGDRFCFKSGGDGDNGEHLMYLIDTYFEIKDESARKG